ncbi:MAG TPA: hypothetical protein ENJ56_01820, partial [Anaerolineae bacterium]|nr:hypothetical protein [Anaerolineae bacterium]
DTAGIDPRDEASLPGTYQYSVIIENGTTITKTVSKFWYHDPDTFDKVGNFGLGDIDISSDESMLFVVNMKDQQLYMIDATQAGTATKLAADPVAIPNNCANPADARPMASKYHDGKVYVGVVCSAESSQNLAELKADVFAFDPVALSFDTTSVLTVPLDYDRGCIWRGNLFTNPAPSGSCSNVDNNANWRPWNDSWQAVFDAAQNSGGSHFYIEYPQPLLADIEFDNGNMALGFRDVVGDRVGYCAGVPDSSVAPQTDCQVDAAYANTTNGQGIYRGTGIGDLLRACGNPTDGWTLENNGSCSTANGQNSLQGPNGGEYYWNANGPGGPGSQLNGGAEWWAQNSGHDQTVIGGLMQIPGQPYIVTNQIDSSNVYNAGLVYFSNADGSVSDANGVRKALVYDLNPDTFGKANGLGDIEALCDAAPTQVGNRVWNDDNANGVQDPSESGAAGVELTLICGANSTTVTTAADGTYLFSNDPTINAADPSIGLATWMNNGEACSIQVTGGAPAGAAITSGTQALNDLHDNDADVTGRIDFTVGAAGENNHNLDIGYATSEHTKPSGNGAIGNYVWLDENSDGVQDAGERGIPNVVVMMTDTFGNIYQTVTDATGKYSFPKLAAGTYTVMVKDNNFLAGNALDGYTQTPLSTGAAAS